MDTALRVWTCSFLFVALLTTGCQSSAERQPRAAGCADVVQRLDLSDRIGALNLLSQAFSRKCYPTVVDYGAMAQSEFRHKTFHVLKETVSVFIPDGTLTDYVLESYERGFLSVLIAASYAQMNNSDDAKVELRKLDHELFAPLYNFGEDPVNILLSAVLWENLGELSEARVDWYRLSDPSTAINGLDQAARSYASQQVARIDEGQRLDSPWQLYGLGKFPGVDWDIKFLGSRNGYFSVRSTEKFLPVCTSQTGLLISTQTWFDKIAFRHNNAYHPLLNIQSWIRLPLGVMYTLVPVAAGATIAIGGCMADFSLASERSGALCAVSIQGGQAILSLAPETFDTALRPDLRHWERIPSAFVITRAPQLSLEPCYANAPAKVRDVTVPLVSRH